MATTPMLNSKVNRRSHGRSRIAATKAEYSWGTAPDSRVDVDVGVDADVPPRGGARLLRKKRYNATARAYSRAARRTSIEARPAGQSPNWTVLPVGPKP